MLAEFRIRPSNPNYIRVVQITDTHIFEHSKDRFDGVDTGATLNAVIDHINKQPWSPDLVIVTGDLVHQAVPAAYEKLRQYLYDLGTTTFCLPGNHDDPALMHALLNRHNVHTSKVISTGQWAIILLDTYLAGTHSGRLQRQELEFLEQQLGRNKDKAVMIGLHHPPVSVASPWMDAMMLENPNDLFSVLDRYSNIRLLIFGHIHQAFMKERGELSLSASPSTCVQFKPRSDRYIKDGLNPGYAVIDLYDGNFNINTQRI